MQLAGFYIHSRTTLWEDDILFLAIINGAVVSKNH